jgi:PAS domain S-box-containing protein
MPPARALFDPAEVRPLLEAFAAAGGEDCRLLGPDGRPIAALSGSPGLTSAELEELAARPEAPVRLHGPDDAERSLWAFPVRLRGETACWLLGRAAENATIEGFERLAEALASHAAARMAEIDRQEELLRLRGTVEFERESVLRLAGTTELDEAVEVLLSACIELAGASRGGVYLVAEDAPILELRGHRNLSESFQQAAKTVPLSSARGRFVSSGKPFYGSLRDFPASQNLEALERQGVRGLAVLPIVRGDRPLGSVNLAFDYVPALEPERRILLENLTAQGGVAIARLRAEAAGLRMRRNLEGLFNATDDFVIQANAAGDILSCNPVVPRRLEYRHEQLLRMALPELYPEERRSEVTEALGKAIEGETTTCDAPLVTRSDTHIAVEAHFVRITWDGSPAVCAVARDVTAGRIAEAQLRQNELRYRGLVESQNDLIVRVDPQGRFTFVNDAYCRTFGKTAEELYRQTFHPLVHEADLPRTLEAMKKLDEPPYRTTVEQRAKTVHGWRWLFWEDVAIKDERGETIEIQAVGRDITDYKRALARAERSLTVARRAQDAVEAARSALAEALEPSSDGPEPVDDVVDQNSEASASSIQRSKRG